jgi:hypothetical protein
MYIISFFCKSTVGISCHFVICLYDFPHSVMSQTQIYNCKRYLVINFPIFWYKKSRTICTCKYVVHFLGACPSLCKMFDIVMKNAIPRDVTPCGSCKNGRFGGMYCLHHQGWRWWKRHVPLKCPFLQEPHGITSQKTAFFLTIADTLHRVRHVYIYIYCSWHKHVSHYIHHSKKLKEKFKKGNMRFMFNALQT